MDSARGRVIKGPKDSKGRIRKFVEIPGLYYDDYDFGELDKMKSEELGSLHDALEQQKIFVNKAGLSATLKCETSLLATANPKFGRFENHDNLLKQIDLTPPLLSRFDLIFCFVDSHDNDRQIADFLLERAVNPQTDDRVVQRSLLRKYLSYARSLEPKLDTKNKKRFIDEYLKLRRKSDVKNITIRQFQAMQRLAVAFAKLRLDNKINKEDIENAIKLVVQTYEKLMGALDFDIVTEGIGTDARNMNAAVLALIPENGEPVSYEYIKENTTISEEDLNDAIERLKSKGEIQEPKPAHYLIV